MFSRLDIGNGSVETDSTELGGRHLGRCLRRSCGRIGRSGGDRCDVRRSGRVLALSVRGGELRLAGGGVRAGRGRSCDRDTQDASGHSGARGGGCGISPRRRGGALPRHPARFSRGARDPFRCRDRGPRRLVGVRGGQRAPGYVQHSTAAALSAPFAAGDSRLRLLRGNQLGSCRAGFAAHGRAGLGSGRGQCRQRPSEHHLDSGRHAASGRYWRLRSTGGQHTCSGSTGARCRAIHAHLRTVNVDASLDRDNPDQSVPVHARGGSQAGYAAGPCDYLGGGAPLTGLLDSGVREQHQCRPSVQLSAGL